MAPEPWARANWRPRVVALDIDGTLYAPAGETGNVEERVRPAVLEAVRRAARSGAHIVLATGRSTFSITDVLDELGLPIDTEEALIVASNGSVLFAYPPVRVLSAVTFDAREIVTMLMEHVPDAIVAVEEIGVGYRVNKPFPDGEISGRITIESIPELVAEPVTRVIIRDPNSSEEEFVELAEKVGLQGTNYFIGWTAWLDLAPEGITKASGLADVCARLGVERADVLAIGDGRNDTDMLRWAGRGVAMGQSSPEVQDAADDVTESVENDGAAVELDRWFRPLFSHRGSAFGRGSVGPMSSKQAPSWLAPAAAEYVELRSAQPDDVLSRLITRTREQAGDAAEMQISSAQGALITLLTGAVGARRALEVGTFTGYSSICIARGLVPEGMLLCCDVSEEYTAVAREAWAEAGLTDRIELRIGPALDTLAALPTDQPFDLAFIDADKQNYPGYYEAVLALMRPGGLVMVDNTLRSGSVWDPADTDETTAVIRSFNDRVAADQRVESFLLPISDGMTLIRKR